MYQTPCFPVQASCTRSLAAAPSMTAARTLVFCTSTVLYADPTKEKITTEVAENPWCMRQDR